MRIKSHTCLFYHHYINISRFIFDLFKFSYNYIFNQLFTFFFFSLKNIFLGFVDIVLTFITSLFLYYETKEINEKASLFLIPYTLFTLFALILNLTIYFMNL